MSKDEILAGTLAFSGLTGHAIVPIIGFLVAGLTAFYMFRLVILTFLGTHKDQARLGMIHESPKVMTVPLVILAALSLFFFYGLNPFQPAETWVVAANERPETVVPASLAAPSSEVFAEEMHHAHMPAMGLSLLVASIGILLAFTVYAWRKIDADRVATALAPLHRFLVNKWYFDELYNGLVVGGTLAWCAVLRWFDNTIIDGVVNGSGWITRGTSFLSGKFDSVVVDGLVNLTAYLSGFAGLMLRKFQTGRVQTYLIFVVMSVMLLYFIFRVV